MMPRTLFLFLAELCLGTCTIPLLGFPTQPIPIQPSVLSPSPTHAPRGTTCDQPFAFALAKSSPYQNELIMLGEKNQTHTHAHNAYVKTFE